MNYLKKLDFLGTSPSFRYENKSTYTSVKGGFVSLLVFAASVICMYFFGAKLVTSELDSATFAKTYQDSPSPLSFKEQEFAFFFGVQDSNYLHIYRDDLLTVKFDLKTRYLDEPSENLELKHKPCELTDFGGASHLFEDSDYNNAYCLDREQMDNITLNSTFGQDKYTYLSISVETCKNTTTRNCAPQQEIDAYADGFFFDFAFAKDIINPNEYQNPGNKHFEDYYASASQNYKKMVTFFFSHIFVKSDVGWIFEEKTDENYYNLGSIKENLELKQANTFLSLTLRLSKEASIWTRNYYKLQHFVAQLGGILKGFLLFAKVVLYPFSKTEMMVGVMNRVALERSTQTRLAHREVSINESRIGISGSTKIKVEVGFIDALLQITPFFSSTKKTKISALESTYNSALNVTNYLKLMTKNFENQEIQGKTAVVKVSAIKQTRS